MTALDAPRFSEFFEALHGCSPFPWQLRLVEHLFAADSWPETLDLPTGSGKTAALDVAVYHLAARIKRLDRKAALRILYVVDRRTIVDQAYERACAISDRLAGATEGILLEVREALAVDSASRSRPLEVALLRGGIAREDGWAKRPDQPLIAVSTVDQVGSRLLFRGYGVSPNMRPVHAGLLGNDVLYLLDEVHLSRPFCETLQAISRRYRGWADCTLVNPFAVVQMSATHGGESTASFHLDEADLQHPVLSRRLASSKPTERISVAGPKLVSELDKRVRAFAARPGATVLAVVNRVDTARRLVASLSDGSTSAFDVELVTGRMRPFDRELVEGRLLPRVRAGRVRQAEGRPLVVVATQCIEAGADFDFDALVTECASLDALRQRFGRLDRLGELGQAPGVVIAAAGSLQDDPVYGDALGATWAWLGEMAEVDFGLNRLPTVSPDRLASLLAPRSHAPVLLPGHLDAWVQTSPEPKPDPDVALWLHGPERGEADCQVVWRADLTEEILQACADSVDYTEAVIAAVDAVPPSSGEAMSVPFGALLRWLRGVPERPIADVEGVTSEKGAAEDKLQGVGPARPCVLWRGDDSVVVQGDRLASALRPGDTVVVPAGYGGMYEGTFDPSASGAVRDLGDIVSFRLRGRAVLRLHPEVLRSLTGDRAAVPPSVGADEEDPREERETVASWLEEAVGSSWPDDVAQLVKALRREGKQITVDLVAIPGMPPHRVVAARRRRAFGGGAVTTEDDSASFTGVGVSLKSHLQGVSRQAHAFAERCGLPPEWVGDVSLAGLFHDLGKADSRFQVILHGGSTFRASIAREPLAKSPRIGVPALERERAARKAGYPRGTRHELQSVAMLLAAGDVLEGARDRDLVLHLVASHHGRCRPFAPWVADHEPVEVSFEVDGTLLCASSDHGLSRLDSGIAERFWRLVRRYGWWGLAWLEAMLRLGDHRQSELEQQKESGA